METATEELSQPAFSAEFENENDFGDVNQDDEFDFEINGGDDLNNLGELDTSDVHNADQPEDPAPLDVETDTHPSEDLAANVELGAEQDYVADQDEEDLVVPDLDHSAEEQTFDPGVQEDYGDHAPAAEDEFHDETADGHTYEDNDYEEASGNPSGHDFAPAEPAFVHELSKVTASVDSAQVVSNQVVSDQGESISVLHLVSDQAQAEMNAAEDSVDFKVTVNDVEAAGESVYDELVRDESNVERAGSETDNSRIKDSSVAVDEQLDWDAEDNDESKENRSEAFPNVTVSYQGRDYFLFAESTDEDPDTYFLDDVELMNQPLSQFLSSVREVISSEIENHQEIILQVDGLGVEFGQSTTQEFIDHTTFADIVELNKRLVQLDGGSQSPELYMYLRVRSNPLHRFAELVQGANDGQGLSHFEKYYEAASAAGSATNEAELLEMAQDMDYDDLSLDDAHEGSVHVEPQSPRSQQADNPLAHAEDQDEPSATEVAFRDIAEEAEEEEEQPSTTEVIFNDLMEHAEEAGGEEEEEEEAREYDNHGVSQEEAESLSAEVDEIDESLAFEATDLHEANGDDHIEDATLVAGLGADAATDEQQYGNESSNDTDRQEADYQAESVIDLPGVEQEALDGEITFPPHKDICTQDGVCFCDMCLAFEMSIAEEKSCRRDCAVADLFGIDTVVDITEDGNYLDLGDEVDLLEVTTHTETTTDEGALPTGIPEQLSGNSSATATLDGDHSANGDGIAAAQISASLTPTPAKTDMNISGDDVDEIDWNLDEDEDIGTAYDTLTNLSPSAPSAKRAREEDGVANGLGDDNGMYPSPVRGYAQADISPAAKRPRTEAVSL